MPCYGPCAVQFLQLPKPCSQAVGEMAWQLPRVQTVYRCNVTVIAISHSTSQYWISACDTIFPAVRMGLSCSRKQLFAVGSTTEVKFKSFKKQSSCRTPILVWSSDRYWNGMDVTATVQCIVYRARPISLTYWKLELGHREIGFHCCHVATFWNIIGTANFLAVEATVWTHRSCQAVSPTAWEWGYVYWWVKRMLLMPETSPSCPAISTKDVPLK